MTSWGARWGAVWIGMVSCLVVGQLTAAVTPEQRKEIADIKKDLGKVSALIGKKQLEEVQKLLTESEAKLKKIAVDAGVRETDKALAPAFQMLAAKRAVVDKKKNGKSGGGAAEVSFAKEIAVVFSGKCIKCHNAELKAGGLRLDSPEALKRGGKTGPLLVPGNADESLLLARLTVDGEGRMPKGGPALTPSEVNSIATWINQGAKFDNGTEKEKVSANAVMSKSGARPPASLVKPTGGETVSFVRDVAPFIVNLCTGCHGESKAEAELSLTTFDGLLRGGASGRIVDPDDWEKSLMWQLVGLQEPTKMPKGPAQLTAKNLDDLETWLREGAKFDGPNPKTPLRNLIPTDDQLRAIELSKLSAEEFVKLRQEKSESQWKRANPSEQAVSIQTDEFILFGDVGEARLKTVADWADEQVDSLRATFNNKAAPIWKGKLAIFLFKSRFAYEEFPRVVEGRDVPREMTGHSKITLAFDEAYVCLEDVGDEVTPTTSGLRLNLIDHLTGAYLRACEKPLPDWVVRGTGLALLARTDKRNEYILGLNPIAAQAVRALEKPADLFANGIFTPVGIQAVGCTLASHLIRLKGAPTFVKFVIQLQSGNDLNSALRNVYNADSAALAASYVAGLDAAGFKKPVRKKK